MSGALPTDQRFSLGGGTQALRTAGFLSAGPAIGSPTVRSPGGTQGAWPDGLMTSARPESHRSVTLHTDAGHVVAIDATRWHQSADEADLSAVSRATGPTLDVGCGPGRIVAALHAAGVPALGIDISAAAVALARDRGAAALQADVFGGVPGAGSWSTALLIDGNIGIGGDPVALLARLGHLVEPAGRVVAEVERPGTPTHGRLARVCHGSRFSEWFEWARVSEVELRACAVAAGWCVADAWSVTDRWFVELSRRSATATSATP